MIAIIIKSSKYCRHIFFTSLDLAQFGPPIGRHRRIHRRRYQDTRIQVCMCAYGEVGQCCWGVQGWVWFGGVVMTITLLGLCDIFVIRIAFLKSESILKRRPTSRKKRCFHHTRNPSLIFVRCRVILKLLYSFKEQIICHKQSKPLWHNTAQ